MKLRCAVYALSFDMKAAIKTDFSQTTSGAQATDDSDYWPRRDARPLVLGEMQLSHQPQQRTEKPKI
jgi:hypothetical protein